MRSTSLQIYASPPVFLIPANGFEGDLYLLHFVENRIEMSARHTNRKDAELGVITLAYYQT